MIDPCIWNSEDFGNLPSLAKVVYVGLISMADDEGRGLANPQYLKSILFPYDDKMKAADIAGTLSEIASRMSVVFFACDEKQYYILENWKKYQTINKPMPSKIPLPEDYRSTTVVLPSNRKEKNIREKKAAAARAYADFYNKNIGDISPAVTEEAEGFIKGGMSDGVITLALGEAACNGVKKWSYAKAVLSSWREKGIRTAAQAEAARKEYRRVRAGPRVKDAGKTFSQHEYTEEDKQRQMDEAIAAMEEFGTDD